MAISLVSLLVSLAIAEILIRQVYTPPGIYSERNLFCRYDSEIGWVPLPHFKGVCNGSRTVHIQQNAMGFRDREHGAKQGPVMAVLGDSFVYGYDAEQNERFTELLQQRIPSWDIFNLGVSGYGTDQEYLLLRRYFSTVQPDVVLLVFSSNDPDDNKTNKRYGYYKPFFMVHEGRLELFGVPVPKCLSYYPAEHPILFKSRLIVRGAEIVWRQIAWRWPTVHVPDPSGPLLAEVRNYVEANHAHFVVAFAAYGPEQKKWCEQSQLNCIDVSSAPVYPTAGSHWTPEGHREAAEKMYTYLMQKGYLKHP
jgi:hypothetical protein